MSDTIEPDEGLYDGEPEHCYSCDDTGMVMTCPDDICRGVGECMHGDGEMVCPACHGESAR